MRLALPVAAVCVLTAGCVSAQPASTGAGAVASAPSIAPQCDLLTSASLQRTLGVSFVAPRAEDPSSSATTTVCQWTASDQSALVITKLLTRDAALVFRSSFEESQRSLGPTQATTVPGAKSAYVVPSLGRTAMLVDDRFVEVSVLVPSATPEQVAAVATQAARSARRG